MLTGLIGLGGLVLLIMLLIGALLLLPRKSDSPSASLMPTLAATDEPQPLRAYSIREQSLNEDAEALAGEFKRVRYEAYLASLRADAAAAFGAKTAKSS
jgi:hypothetical protein